MCMTSGAGAIRRPSWANGGPVSANHFDALPFRRFIGVQSDTRCADSATPAPLGGLPLSILVETLWMPTSSVGDQHERPLRTLARLPWSAYRSLATQQLV